MIESLYQLPPEEDIVFVDSLPDRLFVEEQLERLFSRA
jgi:hypothetical protein